MRNLRFLPETGKNDGVEPSSKNAEVIQTGLDYRGRHTAPPPLRMTGEGVCGCNVRLPCVKGAVAVRRLRDCFATRFHLLQSLRLASRATSLYTREAKVSPTWSGDQ